MAYTVHVRLKNDSSSFDHQSESPSEIEENRFNTENSTTLTTQNSSNPDIIASSSIATSSTLKSSQLPSQKQKRSYIKGKAVTISNLSDSESNTQLRQSSSLKNTSFPPASNAIIRASSTIIPNLPTTPPTTQVSHNLPSKNDRIHIPKSEPARKRSLTLMSPDKITAKNSRLTKKYCNTLAKQFLSNNSDSDVEYSNYSTDIDSSTQ